MPKIIDRIKYYYSLPSQIRTLNQKIQEYSKLNELNSRFNELNSRFNEFIEYEDYSYNHNVPSNLIIQELKDQFWTRMNKKLDLENPKTFDEKIQWLKIYDSTPLKTELADKYKVREWVKNKIGEEYLIPLLGVWDDFDQIDFSSLPNQFVLKTNHSSGTNIIVADKESFNISCARRQIINWMNTNFAYKVCFEMHYRDIKPLIIAEKYLENDKKHLSDYKVYCFNGEPKLIQYLEYKGQPETATYDCSWNRLPYTFGKNPCENDISKPARLNELINLSKTLAKGFALVRTDFYILNSGDIKFGEMTFTPGSGLHYWKDQKHDQELGDLIVLPEKYYLSGIDYGEELNK